MHRENSFCLNIHRVFGVRGLSISQRQVKKLCETLCVSESLWLFARHNAHSALRATGDAADDDRFVRNDRNFA
jgi:hypothetical protein